MTGPPCPTCRDTGWVEEPYYSDFEPTTRPKPCPACSTPQRDANATDGFVLLVAVLAVCAFVIWGATR